MGFSKGCFACYLCFVCCNSVYENWKKVKKVDGLTIYLTVFHDFLLFVGKMSPLIVLGIVMSAFAGVYMKNNK